MFERYAMGLEDGRALIRLGWVHCLWHPAAKGTQVGSPWGIGGRLWLREKDLNFRPLGDEADNTQVLTNSSSSMGNYPSVLTNRVNAWTG